MNFRLLFRNSGSIVLRVTHRTCHAEGRAIVTLNEAARRLNINPHRVRGWVDAKGIKLSPDASALVMSEADFDRLKKAVEKAYGRQPAAS